MTQHPSCPQHQHVTITHADHVVVTEGCWAALGNTINIDLNKQMTMTLADSGVLLDEEKKSYQGIARMTKLSFKLSDFS